MNGIPHLSSLSSSMKAYMSIDQEVIKLSLYKGRQ